MSVDLFPLGEAALPSGQMRDLRRLETSIRHTLHSLEREQRHFRVVVFVALSSSFYFAWSPAVRAFSYLRDLDLVAAACEVFPVLLGVACIFLLLRQRACYEKIHERRIYLQRLNTSLRQLHLFFDYPSRSLWIYQQPVGPKTCGISRASSMS
uniref:Aminotransferase class V domain-containing protein, conserved, putative n=1 Tax=Neospora caninum (strain Liverpool) TaxID=572307 RepID=A0A0F7U335_NEOCL|nr:TPA: aminotransferase class V domain-containing protein, conserved, putative [Neospora caninum Liverpool]